jgi:hypothetical protein
MTPSRQTDEAWNDAYDRLVLYLRTFDLGDHAHVARLALEILQQARDRHAAGDTREPTTLTLALTQKRIAEWLAANLPQHDDTASELLPSGYIAILLSRAYENAPSSFLATPVPEELRLALQETLIVTGPDLNVSSMTPRHLDYGPMLQFARQTWHRVDPKEFVIAVGFWGAVYAVFYWWLSQSL